LILIVVNLTIEYQYAIVPDEGLTGAWIEVDNREARMQQADRGASDLSMPNTRPVGSALFQNGERIFDLIWIGAKWTNAAGESAHDD
jgi:hypothetical protein